MRENDDVIQVNMHEAKSRLSRLGKLAAAGRRVVIAKAGEPYVDLVPYHYSVALRRPGRLAGRITPAPDFDDTPQEVIERFEDDP